MLSFNKFLLEVNLYHGSQYGMRSSIKPSKIFHLTAEPHVAAGYASGAYAKDWDTKETSDGSVIRYAANKSVLPIEDVPAKASQRRAAKKVGKKKAEFRREIESRLAGQNIPADKREARARGIERQVARAIGKATGGIGGRLTGVRGRETREKNLLPFHRPRKAINPTGGVYMDEPLGQQRHIGFHNLPIPQGKVPDERWVGTKFAGKFAGKVLPFGAPVIRPFAKRPGISVSAVRGIPLSGERRMAAIAAHAPDTNPHDNVPVYKTRNAG